MMYRYNIDIYIIGKMLVMLLKIIKKRKKKYKYDIRNLKQDKM